MEIIFKNHVGQVENRSINLCEVEAINVDDPIDAMNNGFYCQYIDDKPLWRQARLTRINLPQYKRKNVEFTIAIGHPINTDRYTQIYHEYMDQRGYFKHPGDDQFCLGKEQAIEYWDPNNLEDINGIIGWSKIVTIDDYVDLKLFAVLDNQLGITSKNTLNFELDHFQNALYRYAYLGPSYQRSAIFKSKIKGFEWWTGSGWSIDTREYIKRCLAD